jgi:glycosyltransferase involved in cell wall biosynthesis
MQASHLQTVFEKAAGSNKLTSDIFFSYIIPTIGRPSLDVAVASVLQQESPEGEFEVIVVNDSGSALPNAEWHLSPRVTVINTNQAERSFARNSGAAVARGSYLAFLDDDDWILPGALQSFWELANERPHAVWLYGGIRIVDEQGKALAEINSHLNGNCFSQIMGGAWAPLQASVIQSGAFFEAGGFNPLICGTEDEDLCRRIAFLGDFASTEDVLACLYRGQTWRTSTNYLRAPEDTKYSRDFILSMPYTFRRLRRSADSSYWHGRVLRVYLSTIPWNLKQQRVFTALSRLFAGCAFLAFSLKHLFSRQFWAGLRADHVPETLHFVMKDYNRRARLAESTVSGHEKI